jgi:6-phosphogluconolactonase
MKDLLQNAEVFSPDAGCDFHHFAADIIIRYMTQLADEPVLVGLSGGSTPLPAYKIIGRSLKYRPAAENLHFIQVDERNVANNSPRSNQTNILNNLFNHDGLPSRQFACIRPGNHDFSDSHRVVMAGLPAQLLPPRPIDLLILGLGSDGHTASLFPETDWRNTESKTGYRLFAPRSQPEQRISLTIDRIIAAGTIIFLVSGSDKTDALARALTLGDKGIPAGYVAATRPTVWILDQAANSSLEATMR